MTRFKIKFDENGFCFIDYQREECVSLNYKELIYKEKEGEKG